MESRPHNFKLLGTRESLVLEPTGPPPEVVYDELGAIWIVKNFPDFDGLPAAPSLPYLGSPDPTPIEISVGPTGQQEQGLSVELEIAAGIVENGKKLQKFFFHHQFPTKTNPQ